ncbi:MAG: response regulator [Burkholderiales bacterium]
MTTGRFSVVIADDHSLVLEGLRNLIGTQADMEVVGEATDGRAACEAVRRLRPDVLIVDLKMSPTGGLEVIREVAREAPGTHIVVLSMHDELPYVVEALRGGAIAYVTKCAGRDELLCGVRAAAAGQRYLSTPLSEAALDACGSRSRNAPIDLIETLTRRERQVLLFVAEGMTNAEIAAILGIGVRTVESHRANVMRKLDFENHAALVRFAIEKGLLSGR